MTNPTPRPTATGYGYAVEGHEMRVQDHRPLGVLDAVQTSCSCDGWEGARHAVPAGYDNATLERTETAAVAEWQAHAGVVVRVELGVEMTSVVNSKRTDVVEIPRIEWDALDEAEREKLLDDYLDGHVANNVDAWHSVLDEEGES